jgi:hypothetical protein
MLVCTIETLVRVRTEATPTEAMLYSFLEVIDFS